jgi:hypothetical protein
MVASALPAVFASASPVLVASALPALLACALVAASGAAWIAALGYRARGPERLGLAFALGVSWLAIATAALGAIGSHANVAGIGTALVLPVVPAILRRRERAPRTESDRAATMREWWSLAPALCVVALSLWLALERPVWNIDAQKRWVLHGQWIHAYHTALPDAARDPAWTTTYPTYPPLVPALVGFALELGADRDVGVRPLFPIVFLALLACVHGYASRTAGRKLASVIALALALTPCLGYLDRAGDTIGLGADAAMADVPLAMLLTAGSILLLQAMEGRNRAATAASCLALAGATLTKQEGSVSALAIAILAAAWARLAARGEIRSAMLRACGACCAAILVAAAGWALLSRGMPVETGNDYVNAAAAGSLVQHLDRLPAVLARVGSELARWTVWGPLWLAAFVALASCVYGCARRRASAALTIALIGAWLVSGIALAIGSYLATGWKGGNYVLLMDVSSTRLLVHHAPFAALALCRLAALD